MFVGTTVGPRQMHGQSTGAVCWADVRRGGMLQNQGEGRTVNPALGSFVGLSTELLGLPDSMVAGFQE